MSGKCKYRPSSSPSFILPPPAFFFFFFFFVARFAIRHFLSVSPPGQVAAAGSRQVAAAKAKIGAVRCVVVGRCSPGSLYIGVPCTPAVADGR